MEPVKSSLGGGVVATAALLLFLLGADTLLGGTELHLFATFALPCAVGGPPFCAVESPGALAVTFLLLFALFGLAWPLLFGGFTWGLPGESGAVHGGLFGLILWIGYTATILFGVAPGGRLDLLKLELLGLTFLAYLVYGVVLGSVYDRLAGHRTFLSPETD
ncbi:hypothetical protein BV210_08860 [Halorientalis sp. IM1011]|uniref:DUF6789 family protein n=1 Tax=Halorientalis sp. IM1011 TaxID=1932360 RepID=UPI00097CD226|nr:DUF6789 family protein [Halorientalis sp. IM1011]AQL42814.1 hypothetical protein BV210_08860 [Halorientalis sp. IM1011]